MFKLPVKIRYEQAIYGSFPFWNRGYAILAHSAGCRPEWLSELRAVCQRCGEPPAGTDARESLFALRLACGPWMIVGVYPQGCDDQGRPGALAFHAFFIGPWAYTWIGSDPFAFAGTMRGDWCSADVDQTLPALTWSPAKTRQTTPFVPDAEDDSRVGVIARAITQGRRAVVQANEPIDLLALRVWRALPRSVRRRKSVATWVFDNANRFDLVGLPRLSGSMRDSSALIIAPELAYR